TDHPVRAVDLPFSKRPDSRTRVHRMVRRLPRSVGAAQVSAAGVRSTSSYRLAVVAWDGQFIGVGYCADCLQLHITVIIEPASDSTAGRCIRWRWLRE
ncbi:hypothetical protein, partial [Roseiconus nitratireducens]|uniref:hypothetical protein n=1 Tax=Roseiconus nitratireducens TaxID=2605748 RepID=UPI001F404077